MKDAFHKAYKKTFSPKFLAILGVGGLLGIFSIFHFIKDFFEFNKLATILIGIGGIVIIFLLRYIWFAIICIYRYRLNIKEHLMFVHFKDIHFKINDLKRNGTLEEDLLVAGLIDICSNIKVAFGKITNKRCSVSIKVSVGGKITSESKMRNLCRDKNSSDRDTENYKKTEHNVFKNIMYEHILMKILLGKRDGYYYINNDILNDADYRNSSKEAKGEKALDYKSELVVPLIPYGHRNEKEIVNNFCGYLCVDSDEINTFDKNEHVTLLQFVADGLFDIIKVNLSE